MSSSDGIPSSLNSDATSGVSSELIHLKNLAVELTETFGRKLNVDLRSFIRKTTTSKDQIRASIRCIRKCLVCFEDSLAAHGAGLEYDVERPIVDSHEVLGRDQLRSNAKSLLNFLKNHIFELYASTFSPDDTSLMQDVRSKMSLMRKDIMECSLLVDRVIMEGYDCDSSTPEESTSEEDD
uniref:Uncharacterized protein n=1 Tax=Noccaea caerulescens TaxID=107243 RepID=A0A1J3HLS7_NOCCA